MRYNDGAAGCEDNISVEGDQSVKAQRTYHGCAINGKREIGQRWRLVRELVIGKKRENIPIVRRDGQR